MMIILLIAIDCNKEYYTLVSKIHKKKFPAAFNGWEYSLQEISPTNFY